MATNFQKEYKRSPSGLLYVASTGSGKTKRALEATRGTKTTVVGTASLTKNFEREEKKFFGTTTPRKVETYSGVARDHNLPGGANLVLDESHYIRNPKTKTFRELKAQRHKYDKVLAMTATPIINEPFDIASQVNIVTKRPVVPQRKEEFYNLFYKNKKVKPTLKQRIFGGVHPGEIRELKSEKLVRKYLDKHTYVEPAHKFDALMPKRKEEVIKVPMSGRQLEVYKYIEGTIPRHLRQKIYAQLPPAKKEVRALNAYLQGLRQVSNTPEPYIKKAETSPKIQKMTDDLKAELKNKGKVLVYSNYLDAGVNALKSELNKNKIQYSELTGGMSKKLRSEQIKKYNTKGGNRVFLMSGAGTEGINLPGTTLAMLSEPHWNKARLYQAASRGIRRGDNPNKTVGVKTYLSTIPTKPHALRFLGFKPKKPRTSVDEYLLAMSKIKEQEANSFMKALED